MRHAEVSYFENGRPVPPDGVGLTEEGRAQAAAAARVLADVPLDRAVATGLPRTEETARIVLGDQGVPVETIPMLHEIRAGRLADIPPAELRGTFVEALTRRLTPEDQFLRGETFGALRERVLPAFRALAADPAWRHLLLVAHGGVNRVILADVLGADLDSLGHIEQDPACINIIDIDERGYGIIRLLNYTPYSPIKTGIELTTMERYFLAYQPTGEGVKG
jgi:phosphoserine phosphatase